MTARGVATLAIVLGIVAACGATAKETVAPAVLAAERAAALLERDDEGALPVYPPAFTPPSPAAQAASRGLSDVARALDAHLARSPRDARALVVRGRLLRVQVLFSEFGATGVERPAPGSDPRVAILALYDRAIAADSSRSDAFYGKALTLITPFSLINIGVKMEPPRFAEALPLARAAHRAAPDDPRRISLLEHCLLALGEDLEAERVRDPAAGADGSPSQVARILERRAQVPPPPGMRPTPSLREHLGNLVQRKPGDRTAAAAWARARRFQAESVPVDTLLAFYRARWPGLTWHEQRMAPEPQMMMYTTRFATASLQWKAGTGWVASGSDVLDPYQRTDVLVLTVEEQDFEQMRSLLPAEALAALPDSLRDRRLPSTTVMTLLDRVEDSP